MVESVTKVLKVHQIALPHGEPECMGMSFTKGNYPKLPRRMMEQPPNGIVNLEEKTSRKQASILVNKFGPMKLISSMRMYRI